MDNLVGQAFDPVTGNGTYTNIANARARGLEFEVAGKYAGGVEGRASYSVQEAVNQNTAELLTNCPKHLGKLNLVVPLVGEKLFGAVEGQYTSHRRTLRGTSLGGFPVVNLTLFNTRVFPRFDLSASLYNAFDKAFDDPGAEEHVQAAIRQDGRSFRIKLTWRWDPR